jgi:hypothetical protein
MRKLDSKTRSCSELEKGAKKVLQVKKEGVSEEELQKQIKDVSSVCCCLDRCTLNRIGLVAFSFFTIRLKTCRLQPLSPAGL